MPSPEFKERRTFERMPSKLSLKYSDSHSNKEALAQTQNISAQGIGLLIDRNLHPYTPLDIWLQIFNKIKPLYIKGKVIWSKKIGKKKYIVGIGLEEPELMIPRVLES